MNVFSIRFSHNISNVASGNITEHITVTLHMLLSMRTVSYIMDHVLIHIQNAARMWSKCYLLNHFLGSSNMYHIMFHWDTLW
jgi:hypothetical protein